MQDDVLTRGELYKRGPKVPAKMGLQMIFSGDFKSHSRSVHQKKLPMHHTGLGPCDRLWPWALASRFAGVLAHICGGYSDCTAPFAQQYQCHAHCLGAYFLVYNRSHRELAPTSASLVIGVDKKSPKLAMLPKQIPLPQKKSAS